MSDITTPASQEQVPAAAEAAPGTSVSEVLLEQVDAKVAAIEKEQQRLQPFQTAVTTIQDDVQKLQAAATASTNPAVATVYQKAIQVAQQLVLLTKEQGQEVVDKISQLQDELESLLAQLKNEDPSNPLIKGM